MARVADRGRPLRPTSACPAVWPACDRALLLVGLVGALRRSELPGLRVADLVSRTTARLPALKSVDPDLHRRRRGYS